MPDYYFDNNLIPCIKYLIKRLVLQQRLINVVFHKSERYGIGIKRRTLIITILHSYLFIEYTFCNMCDDFETTGGSPGFIVFFILKNCEPTNHLLEQLELVWLQKLKKTF